MSAQSAERTRSRSATEAQRHRGWLDGSACCAGRLAHVDSERDANGTGLQGCSHLVPIRVRASRCDARRAPSLIVPAFVALASRRRDVDNRHEPLCVSVSLWRFLSVSSRPSVSERSS